MDLQGNVVLAAPPDKVWQALNNPEVLRVCIPGCEEITALSPTEMQARVVIKMGPVRATFVGKVSMTDVTRGLWPFLLAQTSVLLLLVAFPSLVLVPMRWLL
jgi:carbon monoxide dehydrogenase subunit G